ncbi:hypothetical protein HNP49_001894 [Pseudomonas fluvialis]|uniref:DUF3859 domain-containing protein n=1 Tax=Pseudomonas fluvialis TaxID=1793966 RepID=A0A7X0BUJ0_9PSED|nr:DUF3859 domain-containing protein [Pseudomonas fluvialis]MBB6341726.1 hypothetical protein [Pseudomonas fluvialis]
MQAFKAATLLAISLISTPLLAEVQVQGEIEYGIFQSQVQDFEPGQRVLTNQQQAIETTQVIPAKLGTKFGLRYQLAGKRKGDQPLTLLYLTPGVVTPDGLRHDKFVVQQEMAEAAVADVMAYEFSEYHEVVPGEWHFLVFQGDRKLVEQRFMVQ